MRKLIILAVVVASIAALHAAFLIPAEHLSKWELHRGLHLAGFHFDFIHLEDRGSVFGLDANTLLVIGCAQALTALGLTVLFLSLVHERYKLQLILLSCIVGSSFVHAGERISQGYVSDYFQFGFHQYLFPAFGIVDVAGSASWISLYGFIILRYFRWLPEPHRLRDESLGLADPFYDRRKALRVAVGMFICWGAVIVPIQCIGLAYVMATGNKEVLGNGPSGLVGPVFRATLNIFGLIAAVLVWRMVPKEPIRALFLRSFQGDKSGWKEV